jgi:hypothetical protein
MKFDALHIHWLLALAPVLGLVQGGELEPRSAALNGWPDVQRPYRAVVTLPAEKQPREQVYGTLPLDVAPDLARLGVRGTVDPATLRLVAHASGADVPAWEHDGRLEWAAGSAPSNSALEFDLYFRTVPGPAPRTALKSAPNVPDFFTDHFGQPCDFNDGGYGGITSWGNKPEYIRHKSEGGLLKLDVAVDPYFIWGTMWGSEAPQRKPLRIDLRRYWVLELRVRQNVGKALWELYGRPVGHDDLLHHEFMVRGTNWQTVVVDLRHEAGWSGTLAALRIGPAKRIPAHVEIDEIRLTPLQPATRGAVETAGTPDRPAARVTLTLNAAQPQVGTDQTVTVQVCDGSGRPVCGQSVRLALTPDSGGQLDSAAATPSLALNERTRRALSNKEGVAVFHYRASRRAGTAADRLEAAAEFSRAPPAKLAVTVAAGAPHHYVVTPLRPCVARAEDPPLALTAQLADEFDNPLPGAPRPLIWNVSGGTLPLAERQTSAAGLARATYHGEPANQWVGRVSVKDAAGLTGASAPISTLPGAPAPERVRLLPNGYFAVGQKPWLPLGGFYANWVGVPTADGEWDQRVSFTDATDEQIVAWLKFLKANGVTAERFMLRTHRKNGMEPMDIGGRVNPGLLAAFLHYLDLARPFGFRFLLVLHEDYTKPCYFNRGTLERFCLPWFGGEPLDALPAFQRRFIRDGDLLASIADKYTDPDVIACQDQYAREIVGLVKHHPLLFGYELENEMVACPAAWANHALATVRAADPEALCCVSHGGGGLHTADPAWWKARTAIDFYSYHLYPAGSTSPEMDYGLAVDVLTRYGSMGKPAFPGESAGDEFSTGPDRETRRWTMRDIIWLTLLNGNPGCFFWNARGSEVAEFKLAHEIAGRVDWGSFKRQRPALAVAVPHPLDDDRWFRSEAGQAAYAMLGRYALHYLNRGTAFDFVLESAGGYPLRASVAKFEPPEPPAADCTVSAGYQVKALVREGQTEALLYVRNFSGIKAWENPPPRHWKMYLRERRPALLRVTPRLPGRYEADSWDLDTGEHRRHTLQAGEPLELGMSEHDFAIHLQKR